MLNNKVLTFLAKPMCWVMYYLFALNLLSNLAGTIYYSSGWDVLSIFALSAFFAYSESCFYVCFRRWKMVGYVCLAVLLIFHNMVAMTEFFLLSEFHIIIDQSAIDIAAETTWAEMTNFASTYLSLSKVILYAMAVIVFNVVLYKLSSSLSKWRIMNAGMFILSCFGLLVIGYGGYHFIMYRNGKSVPQYTSVTRIGYSYYLLQNRTRSISQLADVCKKATASSSNVRSNIVVVIGESFSLYHSSLYGYPLSTNPLLESHLKTGNLVLFTDAVSINDHTHVAMKSVFSTSKNIEHFDALPLFPALFRNAGYYTALYDNQYFIGNGINFLTDQKLSTLLFSYRNERAYQYDLEMIQDVQLSDSVGLYVFHLQGQHYAYDNKYPKEFRKFTSEDYDGTRYTASQRDLIAHYDNATLYNDFVLNEIISKFKDSNSCVIYFSDHGEELFEARNYMGHGNAASAPDLRYQIRIPFMVWTSKQFQETYPDRVEQLKKASALPITSDDLPHLLMNIAHLESPFYDSSRSCLDSSYVITPRIVLHSIDYDKKVDKLLSSDLKNNVIQN